MEAFSLLKHWKGVGVAPGSGGVDSGSSTRATAVNVASVADNLVETDDEDGEGGDDDGPFFDLEFAVPEEEEEGEDKEEEEKLEGNATDTDNENDGVESSGDGTTTDGEREFNLMLSSASSNDRTDSNLELSPSDDLLFKGKLVPVESSSIKVFGGSEANSKPQFAVSLLKSATKFRVFMLQFKKSKMSPPPATKSDQKQKQEEKEEENDERGNKKLLTVKFKVEEIPIVSLFNSKTTNKSQKQSTAEESATAAVNAAASDEKFFSKDVMQKYLKKVKPLYIRVSKRYGEKLKLSGQLSLGSAVAQKSSPQKSTAAVAEKGQQETDNAVESPSTSTGKGSQKQGNLQAGLRVVCKHLGKSRSASSVVAAATAPVPAVPVQSRKDDSLLQQQDGIQSAILHCKRSFNASRESESVLLSRSVSDPSYDEKGGKIDV